jgi:hypothetical protein
MQQMVEHMCFQLLDGADFLQVGSSMSVLMETSHTTTGQESIRLVTSEVLSANLMSARQEFYRLAFALHEMCPDQAIFEETNFAENAMDTSSFGSDKSDALQLLRACVGEHDGQQNASKDVELGVLQGMGQLETQTGSRGLTRSGGEGPGLHTSVTSNEWKAP